MLLFSLPSHNTSTIRITIRTRICIRQSRGVFISCGSPHSVHECGELLGEHSLGTERVGYVQVVPVSGGDCSGDGVMEVVVIVVIVVRVVME